MILSSENVGAACFQEYHYENFQEHFSNVLSYLTKISSMWVVSSLKNLLGHQDFLLGYKSFLKYQQKYDNFIQLPVSSDKFFQLLSSSKLILELVVWSLWQNIFQNFPHTNLTV